MAVAFSYHEDGLGFGQFANGDIALIGGVRTGKSGTKGTSRLRYDIYDQAAMARGTSAADARCGLVEINIRPVDSDGAVPDIEGVVDLKLLPAKRRNGIGTRVVEALCASSKDGLRVYDIKKSAVAFWKKVGCPSAPEKGQLNGTFCPPFPESGFVARAP